MNSYPLLKLSCLRDIGWKKWDPIGLLPESERWEDYLEFPDEYDRYLLHVASRLRRDWSVKEAADYLLFIESDHMGLGSAYGTLARTRAEATAKAIKAYVDRGSDT
ncbi:hypothetical protein [Acetobacter sicerae]|uniref:hypothetical protein n=1 Tax=Acetobacter sicerae TaxID=85325 RepID=UPI001E4270FD|nr:hypothetical protein [Acetobacter sicerae]